MRYPYYYIPYPHAKICGISVICESYSTPSIHTSAENADQYMGLLFLT